MRYLLAAALLVCACTRANPDAVGGNGGSAGSGGGGAAGSGGNGGGGGNGGNGGGHDLATSAPDDMTPVPADMTSFTGVFCGTMICMAPDSECCAMSVSLACQSPALPCNGAPYDCDGPEDCDKNQTCCGGGTGSTCNQLNGGSCQGGRVPLCHTLDDCPKNDGFVACCPVPQGGHLQRCSKTACL